MHLRTFDDGRWSGLSNIQEEKSWEHQQHIHKRHRQSLPKKKKKLKINKSSTTHGPGVASNICQSSSWKVAAKTSLFASIAFPGGGRGARKDSLLLRAMTLPDVLRTHSSCILWLVIRKLVSQWRDLWSMSTAWKLRRNPPWARHQLWSEGGMAGEQLSVCRWDICSEDHRFACCQLRGSFSFFFFFNK